MSNKPRKDHRGWSRLRRYTGNSGQTTFGVAINPGSVDAPMDDPATQRLWLRIDVVLGVGLLVGVVAWAVWALT